MWLEGNKNKLIARECTNSSPSTGNSVIKKQIIAALVRYIPEWSSLQIDCLPTLLFVISVWSPLSKVTLNKYVKM